MRSFPISLCMFSIVFSNLTLLNAQDTSQSLIKLENAVSKPKKTFESFTGKISKSKVRIRLTPAYDGVIIREATPGEMVIVLDENEDFYAIKPPAEFKAYVYRTFVLDNAIEGNHVNIRLQPNLEAPVVAQLNSGDVVEGSIDLNNNKWLKINLPENARFYVAKEYVEKIGPADLLDRLVTKKEKALQLLQTNESVSKAEMQKPFDQMNIDGIKNNYNHLILDYPEFPEIAAKAKELLLKLQETYADKKLEYVNTHPTFVQAQSNQKLSDELRAHKTKINILEQQIENQRQQSFVGSSANKKAQVPLNISSWIPVEENYFAAWAQNANHSSLNDFYEEQKKEASHLKGIIEPYKHSVNNKPGDFVFLHPATKVPVAFIYSTHVNLQDYVGHEVSMVLSPRPNNHFALPAFYVLSIE